MTWRRHRNFRRGHRTQGQRGFTLVEVSIVLLVIGCLTWAVNNAYGSVNAQGDRDRATQTVEGLKDALRAFALRNGRLPCPDTSATGTGWEGLVNGLCPISAAAGWLPYYSLQLEPPATEMQALYAVYRNANTAMGNADLVTTIDRTGDLPGTSSYRDTRDFLAALVFAASETPSASYAHLTGNDGTEGAIDCSGNVRSNPAFFVVLPLAHRGTGTGGFEAPNAPGSICTFSPGTAVRNARDDVVGAESFASLTGWVAARAP